MKRKILVSVPLALLFAMKYLQLYGISLGVNPGIFSSSIMLVSAGLGAVVGAVIIAFSFLTLDGRWKNGNIYLGVAAIATLALYFFAPNAGTYYLYNLLLSTSLLVFLYPFHHYEIRKFPAFGYSFLAIYILLESISLWRGEFDPIVFSLYLTLSLVMFLPGLMKVQDD